MEEDADDADADAGVVSHAAPKQTTLVVVLSWNKCLIFSSVVLIFKRRESSVVPTSAIIPAILVSVASAVVVDPLRLALRSAT